MVHLNCVYSGGMNITEEYRHLHKFTIEFYAADTYFYGLETEYDVEPLGLLPAEDRHITIKNGTKYNQIVRIQTGIGATSRPIYIRFYGGYMENTTTGKKISFPGEIGNYRYVQGNYLSADFNPGRIETLALGEDGTVRDGSPAIDWPNTDLNFAIVPGENLIDFSAVVNFELSAFFLNGKICVRSRYESA